ncbi:sensor histidine kinase [Massilia sp. ST3]|uniref:sensor histidine kinase n=1 Tax=Massilia sp. ST3 TaxID=2824903 RepID=UPI001B81D3B0|nr:histidine kinase [Massilia sp. ST3]MBQ5946236.1 histidine kinase [Massilia sp. ST3]
MIIESNEGQPLGARMLLRRVAVAMAVAMVASIPLSFVWKSPMTLVFRAAILALMGVLMFSLLERWPRRLPKPVGRWALQVGGVALVMPLATLAIYLASTGSGTRPFWTVHERLSGFMLLTMAGLLAGSWTALVALIRQKDALARHQALAFDLERSELARQALDARMKLMQAQVAPHFLFNTLANVQALVDIGSPQAPAVLRSLTAYLRAAIPQLDEGCNTLGQEVRLVEAYLKLMHMRMPDRLRYSLHADESLMNVRCPATTVLTLVENAVRHGIDPSEEGGAIEISIERQGTRCLARVNDTGVGFVHAGPPGTGLAGLRERLALTFGGDAQLRLTAREPHGVCAEVEFPALESEPCTTPPR